MKKSTPKPSKADLARFDKLYGMGCIACWLLDESFSYPQIHHLNLGGKAGQKRRGHAFTIPLCEWHHVGRIRDGWTSIEMTEKYGPSLAKQSRGFRTYFGTDDQILALVNDMLADAS